MALTKITPSVNVPPILPTPPISAYTYCPPPPPAPPPIQPSNPPATPPGSGNNGGGGGECLILIIPPFCPPGLPCQPGTVEIICP
jgi:hypothetical protein